MNEIIKIGLLVLWAAILAYTVVTGKPEILSAAMLLASAVIVYSTVNIKQKEIFNKNLDKGDKHDN